MDKTPPRNRLIALYSALAVVTLLGLKPALDAYFDQMHQSALAQGIDRGFVMLTVVGEPPDEVREAIEGALDGPRSLLGECLRERLAVDSGTLASAKVRVRAASGVTSVQLEDARFGDDPAFSDCAQAALETIPASALPSGEVGLALALAPTQAEAVKIGWRHELASGPMTIDDAIARIGQQGRMAFPQIRPEAGGEMNVDPLRGWAQLPQELPAHVETAAAAPTEAAATDAAATDAAPAEATPTGATPAGATNGEAAAPTDGEAAGGAEAPAPAGAGAQGTPAPSPAAPAPSPAPDTEATE